MSPPRSSSRPARAQRQRFRLNHPSLEARLTELLRTAERLCVPLLRISLGVVFVWFGALKLTWTTPVADLVADTVPILPDDVFVTALGAFEVLIGAALLIGRWILAAAALMIMHLGGTFLVLVTQPEVAFQGGNPLLLTMTGEFVVKNLVLITAGIVVIGAGLRGRQAQQEG